MEESLVKFQRTNKTNLPVFKGKNMWNADHLFKPFISTTAMLTQL